MSWPTKLVHVDVAFVSWREIEIRRSLFQQFYVQLNSFSSNNMSSPTYSPGSDDTISRAIDQPASLSGVLINVDMIVALCEEETAVLRHRKSKNRLINETFRACSPPSLIREDHIGKKAKPREAHLSFNARMFRAMANALSWDNPASTEVYFVSEAFRQLSHDEQVSLHGSRHLLKVLLVTRPFTDAEGNEASTNELMTDQHRTFMHQGRRLLMQATSQSSCRMMMLMRMPSTVNRGTMNSQLIRSCQLALQHNNLLRLVRGLRTSLSTRFHLPPAIPQSGNMVIIFLVSESYISFESFP